MNILEGRISVRKRHENNGGGWMVVVADGSAYHILATARTEVGAEQIKIMFISMKSAIHALQSIDGVMALKGGQNGSETV